jgi:hypothetical protein
LLYQHIFWQEVIVSKKWYELFISTDGSDSENSSNPTDAGAYSGSTPPVAARTAAQTVADIASQIPASTKFATPIQNPASFDEIYQAAEIKPPAQGYTIFKIADMLQSEHIRNLPAEVKRSSILVALDAAGVKIEDVIQDAVRRDRALDGFETVQQRSMEQLEERKAKENADIQAEIDRFAAEQRAKIDANNDEVKREKERFFGWRLNKQLEEQKISDAVSYFATPNPITTSRNPAPVTPPAKAGSSS